jgi:hypothetical protein
MGPVQVNGMKASKAVTPDGDVVPLNASLLSDLSFPSKQMTADKPNIGRVQIENGLAPAGYRGAPW